MDKEEKREYCFQVAAKRPLVHCITNYVTAQDVANMILACGASPMMADELQEVEQITAASDALVLNLGTLQERTVASMRSAAQTANEKGIPIVLDPVGIGASTFRSRTSLPLLSRTRFAVIRGNYAELAFLAGEENCDCGRGIDSIADSEEETAQSEKTEKAVTIARLVARQYGCVAVLTGATDVITDGDRTALVSNGVPQMSRVTGTGCMLSGVIGAYLGANEDTFGATVSAVAAMGIAGEISWEKNGKAGLGSFRVGLFDAMGQMKDAILAQRGKLQELYREENKRKVDYSLYLCTDRGLMTSSSIVECVERAIWGGVTVVQLREKDCSSREFYDLALQVKRVTKQYQVPLIINDRVDIALAVDADGVHVGQKDLPCREVRKLVGEKKIVGVSAANRAAALQAVADGADYIGVGAVFATGTKQDAVVIAPEELAAIRQAVSIPMVAIGGIQKQTLPLLKGTGIDGVAVISAIVAQPDVELAARELKELWNTL